MTITCLITGATGMVGGRLSAECVERGWTVRALVRATSDTTRLNEIGAQLVHGDLAEPESLKTALEGVDYVFHCAAKVGDWGPMDEYRRINVDALRVLLEAARANPGLKRFVHLGSLGVYPAQHHHGSDESFPLPENHFDGYTQTKLEAEKLAVQFHREHSVPVVVLRPGFIYGPGDRTVFPPLIENLKKRGVRYVGNRHRAMNCIFVDNLVEAFFLAVEKPEAVGQVYNLTDGEHVSKVRFIESICDGLDLPRPRPFAAPLWLARFLAWWMESAARKRGDTKAPRINKARIKFMGINLDFSIEKARRELGYRPRKGFDEAMAETTAWHKANATG